MLDLNCQKCGVKYQKPEEFEQYNKEHPNVFWRWSLSFCDSCRRYREAEALKKLSFVIDEIINQEGKAI